MQWLRGGFLVPPGVPCLLAGALLSLAVPALADGPRQAAPPASVAAARPRSATPEPQSKPADSQPGQEAKKKEDKRLGRALLEGGSFLTLSAANYWRRYSAFVEDWQFELNWHDQRRKFFTSEGTSLDSNNYRLNWTHAGAGAIYYSIARTNRLSTAESFLFAAGGSLIWEYVAEWREISSINDHIFTSAGGLAIGEPMFQIGSFFRNRPGAANRILTLLSNPILALNDALDGSKRPARVPVDEDHDFRFSLGGQSGALTADNRRPARSAFTLDMRVVTLPGYGAVGDGRGYTGRTLDSDVRFDLHTEGGSVAEFMIRTRSTLFGWWWKRVGRDERGRRRGYDLWLGGGTAWDVWQKTPIVPYDGNDLGMTYRWFEREQPTRYADKVSSVHLPGPTFCLTRYDGPVRTRLDFQATVDFGMVNCAGVQPVLGGARHRGGQDDAAQLGLLLRVRHDDGGDARGAVRPGARRREAGAPPVRFRAGPRPVSGGHDGRQPPARLPPGAGPRPDGAGSPDTRLHVRRRRADRTARAFPRRRRARPRDAGHLAVRRPVLTRSRHAKRGCGAVV